MQYRTMPRGDDKLSVLGFGCMRLPTKGIGSIVRSIDVVPAKRQILHAIDNGLNYLDTAWPYHRGESEQFLGEHILKNGYREKVNIATKLPCFSINRKEKFEEIFDKQLKKLQVEYIDYYLMHAIDGTIWEKMKQLGIIPFMDKIRREGKIRHIGFSFHGEHEAFKTIVDEYDWDFAQVQYNILDEHYQAGIDGIRYAASKGLGIIVMEPLRGGNLVGKMPKNVKEVYDNAAVKKSPADWALSWIFDHPEVTLVLSGMNDDRHIDENLAIADRAKPNMLTETERAVVAQAKDAFMAAMTVPCTGCRYCLPCPQGINIPNALKSLNNHHMFGNLGTRMMYAAAAGVQTQDGKPHWAGSCINCGVCESRCPQHIEIRESLKQVSRDLEGRGIKMMAAVARRVMGPGKESKKN